MPKISDSAMVSFTHRVQEVAATLSDDMKRLCTPDGGKGDCPERRRPDPLEAGTIEAGPRGGRLDRTGGTQLWTIMG